MRYSPLLTLLLLPFFCTCGRAPETLETTKWELNRIDFIGPDVSETDTENPFTKYQLDVTFTHEDGTAMIVPGYFAADGDAAETSADAGKVWRVNFRAPKEGRWQYAANFSAPIAIGAGAVKLENSSGAINVGPAREGEPGRLVRSHPRYRQWAESGEYFLKGASDSPENLLGYVDFDSTYRHLDSFREMENKAEGLHRFADHAGDFKSGPTWQNGKGENIMGAIQYLHDHGANGFYALTMNINGDGKDVWPYVDHETMDRFDVSKLDQWERVFTFADNLGMHIHLVTQETENETLLDGGDTGPLRQLYFRELVARFGHHRALTWNLGEENGPNTWSEGGQTNKQQVAMAEWFAANDPWKNYVSIHTHPDEGTFDRMLRPILGTEALSGLAVQLGNPYESHAVTKKWQELSQKAGAPWIVTIDEVGPWWRGLDPDTGFTPEAGKINNQDSLRAYVLWGNLMAGGSGVEWYFGAFNEHNDLSADTYRTRERAWEWTGYGIQFFQDHLPFAEMEPMDELVEGDAMCLAKPGEVYAVYLPRGEASTIDLTGAYDAYTLQWYNPRTGGPLTGAQALPADEIIRLTPPSDGDWAALIQSATK